MAFQGFLQPQPTLGQRLAQASIKGVGEGAELAQKMMLANQQALQKLRSDRERTASKAFSVLPRLLKDKYNDESIQAIIPIFSQLMRDTDLSEDQAFLEAQRIFNSPVSEGGMGGKVSAQPEETPEAKKMRMGLGRLTKEERAQKEYPYGLASFIAKDPLKALAAGGIGLISPIERASSFLGSKLPEKWFGVEKGSTHTPLSDFLRRKAGISELSPEGKTESEIAEGLAGFIPIERAISLLPSLGKEAASLQSLKELPFVSPKEIPAATSERAAEAISPTLAERTAREAPEAAAATEMRMARLSPKERLFESKNQQKIIQSQLKQYPKYAQEIADDVADRAARYNRVLGPKALETQAQKMEYYTKQLPDVRKAYESSIARVRALENELALNPELSTRIAPLISAAQKSLQEDEFLLRQTLNNAKTGESRVGFDTMKSNAQKKVLDIEDKISDKGDFPLTKKDYNPEFIKQAKDLSKKKPLPATRTDDYFTQVHDAYGQVYKDRLADLNRQIEDLAKTRTLGSIYQRQQLDKQRKVLKNLIDHVEAENAIHRHKIALREMNQRKLAQERLSKLKPIEAEPKVSEVAQKNIWRDRISSAKTTEGKAKVVEEAAEEAAKSDPQHAEQFSKEKEKAKEFFSKEKPYPKADDFIKKSDKKISKEISNHLDKLKKEWESLKNSMPFFWKSRIGREFLIGVGTAIATDFGKEIGIEVPSGLTAILVGYGGKNIRGIRALSHYMTRKVIQKVHVERAKEAYKQNDMKKFKEFSPSIQKKVKESFRK